MYTDTVLSFFDGNTAAFNRFVNSDLTDDGSLHEPAVLTTLVDLILDEPELGTEGSRQGLSRTVSVLLLDQLKGRPAHNLAEALGLETSRIAAVRRARRRLADLPDLSHIVERVRDLAA